MNHDTPGPKFVRIFLEGKRSPLYAKISGQTNFGPHPTLPGYLIVNDETGRELTFQSERVKHITLEPYQEDFRARVKPSERTTISLKERYEL